VTLESLGLIRVAVVAVESRVADVSFNLTSIARALREMAERGCALVVLPELCLTAYSCADLFYQRSLLDAARDALSTVAAETESAGVAAIVGLPLVVNGRLHNCAAFVANGRIAGIVPKTVLPNGGEFYERRWFTSGLDTNETTVQVGDEIVPFGRDLLFGATDIEDCIIGIEICEDLWAIQPPSGAMALAGATVIANPSASNELLGKAEYRRDLVRQQSARCLAAYLYAGAGPGESSTDVVYSGHSLIAEYGTILSEAERFRFDTTFAIADVDLQRLAVERLRSSAFSTEPHPSSFRTIDVALLPQARHSPTLERGEPLLRPLVRRPFVPSDEAQREYHCREIVSIQSTALARRLRHLGNPRAVIGLSGGLDSTLALLVTLRAFDTLGWRRDGIVGIGMPGFGTTARTRGNAARLAAALDITWREISIVAAVEQHFRDIGHDAGTHDVTFENAQARERTQILMDVANQAGGFVVGTGDLSEVALGWSTFNGDHMSMYHVNAGVPKTLVRYLVNWFADNEFSGEVSELLRDISATPISPELLPLSAGGHLQQHTESVIGPYELHDFFLYHAVRFHSSPGKIFALAERAFEGEFDAGEVARWLRVFYDRFFSQQFKRSAMPDGPKVGSVALSPRGDWRMPSDAVAALWRSEIDALVERADPEDRR
jgi:NAD+ synthase (glutamine-hydrolysing)